MLSFMADPKETVVGEWMVKAERDLASAPGGRHDGDGRAAKMGLAFSPSAAVMFKLRLNNGEGIFHG
jgi:hypothetical protein